MMIPGPTVKRADVLAAIKVARDNYNVPIGVADVMIAVLDDFEKTMFDEKNGGIEDIPLAGVFKVLLNTAITGPFHEEKEIDREHTK